MTLSIKERAANVSVTYEYRGHPDFWGGNGRRWDSNAGCLFASYDRNTTYADLIDSLVDDFDQGGDFEDCPDWVDSEVIRQAIKNSFVGDMSDIVDCSATPKPVCRGCGAELETEHGADCPIALELCRDGGEYAEYEPDELEVVPDDCDDCEDYIELPVYICLVEIDAT